MIYNIDKEEKGMNCPRCGKEIPKEQRKCPRCGTEIIFKTTDELLEEGTDILDQLEEHLEKSSSIRTFAAGEIIGNKYVIKGAREERGNFGVVYRVEEKDTNKVWALKSIYEKLLTSTEAAASLKDELAIVLSLDHPNIIKLEDYGSHEDSIYTVSEYWVGVPLHKLVEGRKDLNRPFSLTEIASYFEPVLDAMEYIHNMQLLHGNLIPSNVIVRREVDLLKETEGATPLEEVKVSDLGLFQGLYSHIPQLELVNFSFREFRAPEIYARKAEFLTTRSDIFSLGAILYLLIFMIAPSTEMAVEKINLDERPYPQEIVSILQKCLNPYPEERFESVTALKIAWFALMKEAAKPKKVAKPAEAPKEIKEEAKAVKIEWEAEKTAVAEAEAVMPEKEAVEEIIIETAQTKVEELPKEFAKALDEMRVKETIVIRETAPAAVKKRPQAISIKNIFSAIAIAAVLAVVALFGYAYFVNRPLFDMLKSKLSLPQKQVIQPLRPQPAAPSEEPSVVEEIQPQPPAEEAPIVEEAIVEEQPPAVAEPPVLPVDPRIAEFLAKAKRAIELKKITRPARDSALYYYREVLKIDADNAEAKEGIIVVAKESTLRGDNELASGDLETAERFYRAALGAVPDYQPALAGLNKIRERRAQQPAPAPTLPKVEAPPKPAPPAEETVNLEELIPPKPQEKKEPERAVEKTAPAATQQGSIDIKQVNETIQNQYMGRIRLCYATALEQNPNLAGDVVIRFTIGLEGRVIGADVASATLPDSGAVECIRRRFLIMEFTAPSGGPVTINYRLSFKP